MSASISDEALTSKVESSLHDLNISFNRVQIRSFPGERIVIIEVPPSAFENALSVSQHLDQLVDDGFVTIKKGTEKSTESFSEKVSSLIDPRVTQLVELLNARSRTSEQQPSLQYVKDAAEWVRVAVTRRHHLIFGRRGVGKTALMLEAKRLMEVDGAQTVWVNLQSMRTLSPEHAFLSVAARICDVPIVFFQNSSKTTQSRQRAGELQKRILSQLNASKPPEQEVALIITELQQVVSLFGHESSRSIFIFLDDFHYLAIAGQARFLDMMHAITRDNAAWIKAAGIKHQSRWFTDNPPVGLQTIHDAAIIDLDITLEDPSKAEIFLTSILQVFSRQAKIFSISSFISASALDRLVIASGAVPRDFLLLCASSILIARQRQNSRTTGVQDVNEAAGLAAKIKTQELEDDAASSLGSARLRLDALKRVRDYLLDEQKATYFRVDFQDKESFPKEYGLLQSLMDLRLIHLISSSVSDEHHAGRRFEVYALDLSQFSGSRLKLNLRTLDFSKGFLIVKKTGSTEPPKIGDTPKRLLGILRRGPQFVLKSLSNLIAPDLFST